MLTSTTYTAKELAEYKITVNCYAPGAITTGVGPYSDCRFQLHVTHALFTEIKGTGDREDFKANVGALAPPHSSCTNCPPRALLYHHMSTVRLQTSSPALSLTYANQSRTSSLVRIALSYQTLLY